MSQELKVIDQTYDFIRWVNQHVVRFPRYAQHALGSRILDHCLELFELLLEAKFSREKVDSLRRSRIKVEKIRFLVRLSKDERLLSIKSHRFAVSQLVEIGKQLSGWLRYCEQEKTIKS